MAPYGRPLAHGVLNVEKVWTFYGHEMYSSLMSIQTKMNNNMMNGVRRPTTNDQGLIVKYIFSVAAPKYQRGCEISCQVQWLKKNKFAAYMDPAYFPIAMTYGVIFLSKYIQVMFCFLTIRYSLDRPIVIIDTSRALETRLC